MKQILDKNTSYAFTVNAGEMEKFLIIGLTREFVVNSKMFEMVLIDDTSEDEELSFEVTITPKVVKKDS